MKFQLIPHPTNSIGNTIDIAVDVTLSESSELNFQYVITGDVTAIAWPQRRQPERRDGLWRRTCFEAFINDSVAYAEFNFSPSMQWACYRFDGYRSGRRDCAKAPTQIDITHSDQQIDVTARISTMDMGLNDRLPWRLGLSAVIETHDGEIGYWALAHPPGKPDFHHQSCFTGQIPDTWRA